jgi:hypothetical protein
MHGPINVKSPNNTSKRQMGFNSVFKGLKMKAPQHVDTWETTQTRFASRKTWKLINFLWELQIVFYVCLWRVNWLLAWRMIKSLQMSRKSFKVLWRNSVRCLRRYEVNMSTESVLNFCNIDKMKIQQKASVLCLGLSGLFREQRTNLTFINPCIVIQLRK